MAGVNIVDILSKKTEVKKPNSPAQEAVNSVVNDFAEKAVEVIEPITEPTVQTVPIVEAPEVEEIEENNPEQSAAALIDMIDIAQKMIFTFWGTSKLRKKIPEHVMAKFIELDVRDMAGEELNEKELKQLQRYKEFDHRLQRFVATTPFTKTEREELELASQAFVTKSGINIPPSLWFGAQILSIVSKRGIDVMLMV